MENEYKELQRLGHREPRSKLLPPYLLNNLYFKDFSDAIDKVWDEQVDQRIDVIKHLRKMWVTNPTVEAKIDRGELVDLEDWTRPERSLLVKQVNLLGMKLKSAGLLTDQNYLTVSRFLGLYWFGKGTENFIQFINFALILDLEVFNLWSEKQAGLYANEYYNLTREGPNGEPPGTPIWEGGDWFPTTHVEITAHGGLSTIDIETLTEFFYEIANYNLVLHSVDADYKMPVVPDVNTPASRIVAAGIVVDNVIVCSTEGRYGTAAPEVTNLDSIPTRTYGMGPVLLGKPSAWFADSLGRKFPVYNRDAAESDSETLPTSIYAAPSTNPISTSALVGYPAVWTSLPGSPRMGGALPGWPTQPTITDTGTVATRIWGSREVLLSNPKGFVEINGNYVPYW